MADARFWRNDADSSPDSSVSWPHPRNLEHLSKIKEEDMWNIYPGEMNFNANYSSDAVIMDRKLFEEIPHVSSQEINLQDMNHLSHVVGRHDSTLHQPRGRQRDSARISPEKSIARERSMIDSAGNITLMTETVYKCNKCEKTFYTRSGYRKHQRNHSEENNYACTDCGEGFVDYASYNLHKDMHTGGRPWACTVCSKRFKLQSHLTRHERTHTGERPYFCNVCGKCFGQCSSLATHMRTHTGEKPMKMNGVNGEA